MSSFEPSRQDPVRRTAFVPQPLSAAAPGFRRASAPEPAAPEDPEAARARLRAALEQAYEEGRLAGRAELPWQEAEALRSACTALVGGVRALDELRSGYLRAQRRGVVELALALAERVLGRECSADPEMLLAGIDRALERLPAAGPVVIALAPADHALLAQGDSLPLDRERELQLEVDSALEPGSFRLGAGASEIDARPETLLRPLAEALRELAQSDLQVARGAVAPGSEPAGKAAGAAEAEPEAGEGEA